MKLPDQYGVVAQTLWDCFELDRLGALLGDGSILNPEQIKRGLNDKNPYIKALFADSEHKMLQRWEHQQLALKHKETIQTDSIKVWNTAL